MNRYSQRYVLLCVVLWFITGVVFGVWAANGFPMGVLL